MSNPRATPDEIDPVRAKRAQVAKWTLLANRVGYLFVALAMALFVIAFAVGFLVFAALGMVEFARTAEAPRIQLIGYMSALLIASGAAFHLVVGIFHVLSLRRAIPPSRSGE